MKTHLNHQESSKVNRVKKPVSFFIQRLVIVALAYILLIGHANAQDKPKWDPAWDEIDSKATKVAELEGGQLYTQNAIHIVVLNGTYYEMGRQYGHLLKEQINWHFNQIKNEQLLISKTKYKDHERNK